VRSLGILLTLTTVLLTAAPATAYAQPHAHLSVALTPEKLGAGTTISFGFTLTAPNGHAPPPRTTPELSYPANIDLITSGLGLETCQPIGLELFGPRGCPPDSLMGYGRALVELPFSPEPIEETGSITTWMGPIAAGQIQLLFFAEGHTPVSDELIFSSILHEAQPPYGGTLDTAIPPIRSVPEAPYGSVTRMHSTLGPKRLTYYTYYHGQRLAYHPLGLRLPHTCPHGGFPFAATFTFEGEPPAHAYAAVACPPRFSSAHATLNT